MSKRETTSDDCISNAEIQALHDAIIKSGTDKPLDSLIERETALGAYVVCFGHHLSETLRSSGVPTDLVNWAKEAVMAYMLVCIEAQRQAHYNLWRDFMGESTVDDLADNDGPKGGQS
jgi:hypothetical protein